MGEQEEQEEEVLKLQSILVPFVFYPQSALTLKQNRKDSVGTQGNYKV